MKKIQTILKVVRKRFPTLNNEELHNEVMKEVKQQMFPTKEEEAAFSEEIMERIHNAN